MFYFDMNCFITVEIQYLKNYVCYYGASSIFRWKVFYYNLCT